VVRRPTSSGFLERATNACCAANLVAAAQAKSAVDRFQSVTSSPPMADFGFGFKARFGLGDFCVRLAV
jgi:hypothetical protein